MMSHSALTTETVPGWYGGSQPAEIMIVPGTLDT